MKLTESQKQMLFESAKRMLVEADYPIGLPNPPRAKQAGPQSNSNTTDAEFDEGPSQDTQEQGDDFNYSKDDEFKPSDFSDVIKTLYLSYKSILVASEKYITIVDKLLLGYNSGSKELKYRWDNVYVKMEELFDETFPGNQKNLNKSSHNFTTALRKLVIIINGTNIPTNKAMYIYFYNFFKNLMKEYYEETYEYFDYLKHIRENVIKQQLKMSPENNKKYHVYSFGAKKYLERKIKYYYKMNFEQSGTNKGFYKHVRDLFMNGADFRDSNDKEYNPYDGQVPHGGAGLPYKGDNDTNHRRVYYAEENRLLNRIHELTQQYIASNYKDNNIKNEIDRLRQQIKDNEQEYFKKSNNTAKLKADVDNIRNYYKGDGVWNDFHPGSGSSSRKRNNVTPNDPKRDNYRSTTKHQREPGFRQGNWDHDLQDYGRDNNRDINDYGGRDD